MLVELLVIKIFVKCICWIKKIVQLIKGGWVFFYGMGLVMQNLVVVLDEIEKILVGSEFEFIFEDNLVD